MKYLCYMYVELAELQTVPVLPFSTTTVDSAFLIKSRSSVLGTSPWHSVITFALRLVGHFSKNLFAVTSSNSSLKSCSICNTKNKVQRKLR